MQRCILYVLALYVSHCKQRLLPQTTLTLTLIFVMVKCGVLFLGEFRLQRVKGRLNTILFCLTLQLWMRVRVSPKKWTYTSRSIKAFAQQMRFVSGFLQERKPRIYLVGLTKASVQLWEKCTSYFNRRYNRLPYRFIY